MLANLLQLVTVPVVIRCAVIITGARTDVEVVLAAHTPTILFAPLLQTLAAGTFIGHYHVAQTLIANSADPRKAFE